MSKLPVALILSALALFGCSSGDGGSASVDDFCDRLRAAGESGRLDPDDDPESMAAAADEFTELAEVAPEEISGAFAVFAAAINELAELDAAAGDGSSSDVDSTNDMADFGAVMELMLDPKFIAATEQLSEYAEQECGFDPAEAGDTFGGDTETAPDAEGSGDTGFGDTGFGDTGFGDTGSGSGTGSGEGISLEDLDAVMEAASNAGWGDRIVSTGISGGSHISLYGRGAADEFVDSEPLTVEEANQACEAMLRAFGERRDDLEVIVGNGETDLVTGSVADGCGPI